MTVRGRRSIYAAALPAGAMVAPGDDQLLRRRPTHTSGLPWKDDEADVTFGHPDVDAMIVHDAAVAVPAAGGGQKILNPMRQTLRVGLEWLYDVEQPDTAIVTPHGIGARVGDRVVAFLPQRHPLVTITAPPDAIVTPERGRHDVAAVAVLLHDLGRKAVRNWPGETGRPGFGVITFQLADVVSCHVRAALERYTGRCPTHHTLTCSATDACTWLADGLGACVEPAWPVLPEIHKPNRSAS